MIQALLSIIGERTSGDNIRTQNVTAVTSVANIVRTSLGPNGLDKMMIDDKGQVSVTNDGATIMNQLNIKHPAGKVLQELSQLQDQQVGDGTTTVVLIGAELFRRGNQLVQQGIHPTTVIKGYRRASQLASKFIKQYMAIPVASLGRECFVNVARTSLASKLAGGESDFFSNMVVDALTGVKTTRSERTIYPVQSVTILKAAGRSARDSLLIDGFALNCRRASQNMPKVLKNVKIAIIDFPLQILRLKMGVHILLDSVTELESIRAREKSLTHERIQKIISSGANVVLCTQGIDSLNTKYFDEAGIFAVRYVSKSDARRIASATGATVVTSLATLDGGEEFTKDNLGMAGSISEERVGDNYLIYIKDPEKHSCRSILLRGPNDIFLDEIHRSLHDALCAVRRALETQGVVPGGGAVETALSVYLEQYATQLEDREQLAIAEFAEALLYIPKTLSFNSAYDATELVAELCALHIAGQAAWGIHEKVPIATTSVVTASKEVLISESQIEGKEFFIPTSLEKQKELIHYGLDLFNNTVRNSLTAGILEPVDSKIKSLSAASEACIQLLRIDDFIRIAPAPKPEE